MSEPDRERMSNYILESYPSGVMNGRLVKQMPDNQILAIYTRLSSGKYRKNPKQLKGQTTLFD